jgi:hypothetical protein
MHYRNVRCGQTAAVVLFNLQELWQAEQLEAKCDAAAVARSRGRVLVPCCSVRGATVLTETADGGCLLSD